jgi:hypothetical protein
MHLSNNPSCQGTAQSPADNSCSRVPLDLFKSGQLLVLKPNCRGGLIIQKPFYADFVGPGAAVGGSFDIQSTSVYVMGEVEFYAPTTYEERQQAFQTRIAYIQKLQEVLSVSSSIHRACLIIHQLSLWLGVSHVRRIPFELVAQLGGVLPKSVEIAWQQVSAKNTSRIAEIRVAQ